jgi:hypothetical protein
MSDTRNDLTDSEVSEIMKKIKNNLNKRNQELPCQAAPGSNVTMDLKSATSFDQDFKFIHENSNIQNESYVITSHRPFFGYFLIKGRELVNGEIKRYSGHILFKQSLFNRKLVRIVSEIRNAIIQNQDKIVQIEQSSNDNSASISELNDQLAQYKDHFKSEIIQLINERCDKYETYLKPVEITKWGILYSNDISEKDLIDNIEYHSYFIDLIRKYAKISAKSKIPKIIEIGLGNGTMSIFFSRNELCEVYGIDNDIEVLRHCINNNKKLGGYAKFLLLDAFDLNLLKKKEFDVAFSQGTLEHFDNESIIKILSKQLEIATYVVFSVPSVNWTTSEIGNERKMTLDEWRTLLNEGGFNRLDLEYYKENLHIVGVISN